MSEIEINEKCKSFDVEFKCSCGKGFIIRIKQTEEDLK